MKKILYLVLVAVLAAASPVWGQSFGGGTGTATDPYKISTADHWNQLATNVNNGTTYSGMFFQQTANISVTTVVGYVNGSIPTPSDKAFCGTYDGGGFTLNVTITGYNRYMAPFRYINGATIKNLVVTGSVTSDDGHPSGLVGITGGTCIIENCLVQTNVRGNTYKGGIIGHTLYANITLTGCAYTGTITLGGGYTGGLIGWGGDNGGHTLTITNCFFNGTTSGTGNFHPIGCLSETNVTYTNTRNVSNTYYSVAPSLSDDNYNSFVKDLTYKGKQVYSVTGGTDVTVAKAGTPTLSYNVSGLSFYGSNGGIKCGDAIYGSDGDAVSLTLNHADPAEGYAFDTYSANNGTLTGTNNPYTLTMADANSVITALWKRTYTLLNIPEGWTVTADGQAVNVTDSTAAIPPGATVVLTPTNVNLVKKVTLKNPIINLDTVKHNITVRNGWKLTGTLDVEHYPVKISIADGATVTLDSVTINGTNNQNYNWAGITCLGNATIILKDGTENTVKGFYENYPGVFVYAGYTLTITGGGKLIASSNGHGAGIGGGWNISCGNINIQGGIIEATGGEKAAGIGGGYIRNCGSISITDGVTRVTATKGADAPYSIGIGFKDNENTCGTVTFGTQLMYDGSDWTTTPTNGQTYGGLKFSIKTTTITDDTWELTYRRVDLSQITADSVMQDGDVLTGTLAANVKISIAAGATVTLDGVSINADGNWTSGNYAGITCEGNATIILKDDTTNTVKGFYEDYPGIHVPVGSTLTIQGGTSGTGKLIASSNGYGAGIGGGYEITSGSILIESGIIEATGGSMAAGIGSGANASCGAITITGGTIEATGGWCAAGIGSGCYNASCGDIMITSGVTRVTATKGADAPYSIGAGDYGTCGTVTIGGTQGAITNSPYTYQPQP